MAMHARTVFFISDGTGITAETFGNAINTGRFLMLLVHLVSVVLLFE